MNNRKYKPLQYAYAHRKKNKSNFKKISSHKINTMVMKKGLKFNTVKHFLKSNNIKLNTKLLLELSNTEVYSFNSLLYLTKLKEYNNLT